MAQGALDIFLRKKVPAELVGEYKPPAGDDAASNRAVLDSGELDNEESDVITDVDLSIVSPQQTTTPETDDKVEVVRVLDIFKRLGSKPKAKEELTEAEEEEEGQSDHNGDCYGFSEENVVVLSSSPVKTIKSGITASDILMRNVGRKLTEQPDNPGPEPSTEKFSDLSDTEEVSLLSDPEDQNDEDEREEEEEGKDIICIDSDIREPRPLQRHGISAKDLLTGRTTKPVEILSDSDVEDTTTDTLKKNKKSRRTKNNKSKEKSLLVKFKYKTHKQKIIELEKKFKNDSAKTISSRDLLGSFSRKVDTTESAHTQQDPKNDKDNRTITFASPLLLQPISRKNPISKLKEVPLPELSKEQVHVTYDEPLIEHRSLSLCPRTEIIMDQINYNIVPSLHIAKPEVDALKSFVPEKLVIDKSRYEIASTKIHRMSEQSYFNRFVDLLRDGKEPPPQDIWTDSFKPQNSDDILADPHTISAIKLWLSNSFKILRKATKRPDFKKGKKSKILDDMDDFIVDEYDSDVTEDEEYVPLMILHGPHGVGKSSSVYALVQESNGYVYEINGSQNRSRKDILGNLKELSTTQLVHQNQGNVDSNVFQNGVILFEDVDILFEQDKGFWSVIENLVTISRRPIIITCSELSAIPSDLLNLAVHEQSVFELRRQSAKLLKKYLFLVGLVHNICIDEDALNQVLTKNDFDLRRSLNDLQFLCKPIENTELTRLRYKKRAKTVSKIDEIQDLQRFSSIIDLYSITENVENNQRSLLNRDTTIDADQLLNFTPLIHDPSEDQPLPFEFNYKKEVFRYLPKFPFKEHTLDVESIIETEREFYKSKLKQTKRITRNMLTSSAILEFSNDSYDNEVFDILPSSTYVTDVSPIMRQFARYDLAIQNQHREMSENDTEERPLSQLIQERLTPRTKFQGDPCDVLNGPLEHWV
jgi:telomere length regulation protein